MTLGGALHPTLSSYHMKCLGNIPRETSDPQSLSLNVGLYHSELYLVLTSSCVESGKIDAEDWIVAEGFYSCGDADTDIGKTIHRKSSVTLNWKVNSKDVLILGLFRH